ncbi:DUF1285 domain-containing protein [Maricaulis sp.]|uniref:DUF1285 domain-containing protein n=1 Tax=Maricaulis sp. TaxID=1486257 RepID=UPI0026371300|nr:DUF1285 domain-containing protein [Maricaulis sp.]
MPSTTTTSDPMQSLLDAARKAGGGLPPVDKWNPEYCGEMDLVIKRDGTWWHEGTRITRDRLVRLFSTILRKDDDGIHYLVTPVEKIGIEVEVAPFVAIRVDAVGEGREQSLIFTTNVGDLAEAGPGHPLSVRIDPETGEPTPLVRVRGRLDALLARPVFYELAELAVENDGVMGVWSGGEFFPLGDGHGPG